MLDIKSALARKGRNSPSKLSSLENPDKHSKNENLGESED
jgi:hypothetical protein